MKKIMLTASLAMILAGCYNDKSDQLYPAPPVTTNACDTTTITYSHDVAPIINANCATSGGCHRADGNAQTNNLDFTIFATLQSQATKELMIADITGQPQGRGHQAMPLNLPALSQCDINKLTRWVNLGAPNN